jgi:hypothetical protein
VDDDGEGLLAEHRGPAGAQHLSRPGRVAGHERVSVRVQDQHSLVLHPLPPVSALWPVTSASPMSGPGLLARDLDRFDPVCSFDPAP